MSVTFTLTRFSVIALLVVIMNGCVMCPEYAVVLQNVGHRELDEASIVFDRFESVGGILIPGSLKSHGHVPRPMPEIAVVQWLDVKTGTLHQKEVKVKSILPRRFSGEVYFKIDDANNVTVVGLPYNEKN